MHHHADGHQRKAPQVAGHGHASHDSVAALLTPHNKTGAPEPTFHMAEEPLPAPAAVQLPPDAVPENPIDCPKKHGLQEFYTPVAGFACNVCGVKGLPRGARMFACRECNYDVCEHCAMTRGIMERTPARQAPTGHGHGSPHHAPPQKKAEINPRSFPGPTFEQLKQLDVYLNNRETLKAHSRRYFNMYDKNRDSKLSFDELKKLCGAVNSELRIAPVDDTTVESCLKKFDTDQDGCLNGNEFVVFYQKLMAKVRFHYGQFKIRREFFLDKTKGKPGDHYKVLKTLGQGSFGVAQLVEDKRSGDQKVLKTVNKARAQMPAEELEQEIVNMRRMDHPHIVRLFEYMEDYNNVYMVMEAAYGGELLAVIEKAYQQRRPIGEKWTAEVFRQVTDAIAYCHEHGLMHKDLKAENIMLLNKVESTELDPISKPHAVVIDLGLAEMFKPNSKSRMCAGTPYTMAPQVWQAALGKGSFGPKCDVYSLGCVLFHVLTGEPPLMGRSCEPKEWIGLIKRGADYSPMKHCSPQAVAICKAMMKFDEEDRPSARELLTHQWFNLAPETHIHSLSETQIEALREYSQKSSFGKTILLEVATELNVTDIPRINQIFRELDEFSTGTLKVDQVRVALQKLGVPAELAEKAAPAMDLDGNDRVEYSELVAGMLSMWDDHIDRMLWQVFTTLDTDGSGSLEIAEIRKLLEKGELHHLGLHPANKDIEDVLGEIDHDGSGTLSFDEFKAYFMPRPDAHE